MYTVNNFYTGCMYTGEFIKNGRRYKIYRLPNNARYQGFTANQLFDYFASL